MLKKYSICLIGLGIAVFAIGCSSKSKEATSFADSLPRSWYKLSEEKDAEEAPPSEAPSEKTDRAVSAVFDSQTAILENVDANPEVALDSFSALTEGAPERKHWRLDGMIASFSVSVNGVFGALLGNGTPTVKGTWQKVRATPPLAPKATPKKDALYITTEMTEADLVAQLEPAIRSSLATGSIHDEKALRNNLHERGKKFLTLCQALRSLKFLPGWHVEGLQMQLSFNAAGQVTQLVGVGVGVSLYFDWQMPEEAEGPEPQNTNVDPKLAQNVSQFAQIIAAELPEAVKDTPELKKAGFVFDSIHLGVGLTVGGSIGLAQASGAVMAQLIFKKEDEEAAAPVSTLQDSSGEFINLVGDRHDRLYRIERKHFRKGLHHALRMGAYFAKKARKADSARWKITQIETELDLSLGGNIALANVSGMGMIVLDFDRVDP